MRLQGQERPYNSDAQRYGPYALEDRTGIESVAVLRCRK